MHYVEQVQAHYRALWRMGISVDIVDEECDISGYKLVIAPCSTCCGRALKRS